MTNFIADSGAYVYVFFLNFILTIEIEIRILVLEKSFLAVFWYLLDFDISKFYQIYKLFISKIWTKNDRRELLKKQLENLSKLIKKVFIQFFQGHSRSKIKKKVKG